VAVVKATVFYLGGKIAVCQINHPGGAVSVAEASVEPDGTVRVLPQTIREATVKTRVTVVLPDEATAQDEVDRLALQMRRFRQRLKRFDRAALAGSNVVRVRAQARAAVRDIGRLLPCLLAR
jgi:hypothetical protein